MARPLKVIDAKQVERLARIQCSNAEMAAVLDCDPRTLERRFAAAIKRGRENGKQSLKRAQYKQAMKGNTTMLIWLGKQHLGQADQQQIRVGNLNTMSDDELKLLAAGKAPSE